MNQQTQPQQIQIAPKLMPLFEAAARHYRYIVVHGGRASGKSWAVALLILSRMMQEMVRVLCVREVQTSISASSWSLFRDLIRSLGLDAEFNITDTTITCRSTGAEIIFSGLHGEGAKIRSYEGIGICWIEEAQQISKRSLETLDPTIRRDGAQIVATMNPVNAADACYAAFVAQPRPDTLAIQCNYTDNPFCSDAIKRSAEWCLETSPDDYEHIWKGGLRQHSEAAILYGKYEVREFDIAAVESMTGAKVLYGCDFGFSRDPLVALRLVFVDHVLYIASERYGFGVDADNMVRHLRDVPGIREGKLWCDSAAPSSIAMLVKGGLRAMPAPKWQGSVDDGIRWLRGLKKIVCHPTCKSAAEELRMWSWKIDARTGEITSTPKPGFDHAMDAIRYACAGAQLYGKDASNGIALLEAMGRNILAVGSTVGPDGQRRVEIQYRQTEAAAAVPSQSARPANEWIEAAPNGRIRRVSAPLASMGSERLPQPRTPLPESVDAEGNYERPGVYKFEGCIYLRGPAMHEDELTLPVLQAGEGYV